MPTISSSGSIRVTVGFQRQPGEEWPLHKESRLRIEPTALSASVSIVPESDGISYHILSVVITDGYRLLATGDRSSVPARRQGGYWYRAFDAEAMAFLKGIKQDAANAAEAWWHKQISI